jgi:hypothetical protein
MVDAIDVNYVAVVLAAIVQMAVGFVWYAKPVLGRQWMGYVGKMEDQIKQGAKPMLFVWMFVASLITAYVLAHFVAYTDSTTAAEGMQAGFWLWLGFVATSFASTALFEGRPRGLYMINVGFHLVSLVLMGAVLAVMG